MTKQQAEKMYRDIAAKNNISVADLMERAMGSFLKTHTDIKWYPKPKEEAPKMPLDDLILSNKYGKYEVTTNFPEENTKSVFLNGKVLWDFDGDETWDFIVDAVKELEDEDIFAEVLNDLENWTLPIVQLEDPKYLPSEISIRVINTEHDNVYVGLPNSEPFGGSRYYDGLGGVEHIFEEKTINFKDLRQLKAGLAKLTDEGSLYYFLKDPRQYVIAPSLDFKTTIASLEKNNTTLTR